MKLRELISVVTGDVKVFRSAGYEDVYSGSPIGVPEELLNQEVRSAYASEGRLLISVEEPWWIEYWWNRQDRYWVVKVFDGRGVEQDTESCPNKEWLDITVKEFVARYHVTDIRKVK